MAQNFPTSPEVIYETLTNDTEFMSYVGTYKFQQNNQVVDAISIVSPGEDLPAVRRVQGLEVIIQDAGEVKNRKYYDSVVPVTTWPVFLVVWSPGKGIDMQNATNRALQLFPGGEAIQVIAAADGLGAIVQNKIMIKSDSPILAA